VNDTATINADPRDRYESILDAVDTRTISLMRVFLALSALLLIAVDNTTALAYGVLLLYSAYSIFLYAMAIRGTQWLGSRALHWIDVGWYLLLVALSGVAVSVFFLFFFFAILVASFRWGFREGMRVSIACAVSYWAVGLGLMPISLPHLQLEPVLLRPIYLLVLGYMIARWGESEILQKRRLALLNEVNRLPNPRLGVDHAFGVTLERLRGFYEADACLVVIAEPESSSYVMHLTDRDRASGTVLGERIGPDMAQPLLALPGQCGAVYRAGRWWNSDEPQWYVHCEDDRHAELGSEHGSALASLLDAQSFVCVPLQRGDRPVGRLYLTAKRQAFTASDVHFLRQLVDQISRVIDNIVLLDRIASDAAGHERQKISRDLHDSTIQPYVGLKLGLEAVRRKMTADDPFAGELDDLCKMTNDSIADLRRYVGGLNGARGAQPEFLIEAVWRQAEKFEEFYGIEVEVNSGPDLGISDRLAAEVLHIVNEGLSNIRRHTQSTRATVNLRRQQHNVMVQIINHGGSPAAFQPFTPRSITERTNHLGGKVEVTRLGGASTAVTVDIPL
jgi:signal transduction histidine kinase